jgi:hypothetical protein
MSPHFFEQPPPSSTPRSRIDTKLYLVVTITELFPMARSEIFFVKRFSRYRRRSTGCL